MTIGDNHIPLGTLLDWAFRLLVMVAGSLTLYYNTLGSQSNKINDNATQIAVLTERTGSLSGNYIKVNENSDLVRREVAATRQDVNNHMLRMFEFLITGKKPAAPQDSSFLMIQDSDLELLKEELKKEIPIKTERSANQESKIIRELEWLNKKEKAGELTIDEAIHKGRLEDNLAQIKQQQILESLKRSHNPDGVLNCDRCRKLCGPFI